jgi:hypothetical protein
VGGEKKRNFEIFSLIHFWCATYYKINFNPEVRINPKIKAKNETPYCSRQRSVLVTAWVRDILRPRSIDQYLGVLQKVVLLGEPSLI